MFLKKRKKEHTYRSFLEGHFENTQNVLTLGYSISNQNFSVSIFSLAKKIKNKIKWKQWISRISLVWNMIAGIYISIITCTGGLCHTVDICKSFLLYEYTLTCSSWDNNIYATKGYCNVSKI